MRGAGRVAALATVALLGGPAAAASGQALPPSLTTDTSFAFAGVVEYDFTTGVVSEDSARGAGIDPGLDRQYAVGGTAGVGGLDVAVVARRSNGALDPTFDTDGTRVRPTMGNDYAVAMAVLPDHRLRIAVVEGSDVVVLGLLPDGDEDDAFGGGDGKAVFVPPAAGEVAAIAADGAGRLALTGTTSGGDDTFVAVLEADGTPAAFGTGGVAVRDAGAGDDDGGVDVAWRPGGGPIALAETRVGPADRSASLLALTASGADDTAFAGDGSRPVNAGGADTTAGGLVVYGGRVWATGSVTVGADVDAYLARYEAGGDGEQTRRFDMRGAVFPAGQQVTSAGRDLAIVTGEPDTLVVGGVVSTDRGAEVAAAAFNLLDGPLDALQTTELAIPVEGQGDAVGVAGGANGAVALAVSMVDFSLETGSGSMDESIGMARALVDVEKQCDLALTVVAPLELTMRGLAPSTVTLRASNGGKRACGGTVGVPSPYATTPAELTTGKLGPGQSVVLTPSIAYGAPLPADDMLEFTLTAPGDAAPGDNVARVHVLFSFCDLQLRRVEAPRVIGFEGSRRYGFSVRNVGTTDCRRAAIAVGRSGRRALLTERYAVPPGQSVTDEVMVAVRRRLTRPGARAPIAFSVSAAGDVQAANDDQAHRPLVVRVGDTNARRPDKRKRLFTGSATAAKPVPGVRKRDRRVTRVELAIRRAGKRCRWLATDRGDLRVMPKGVGGTCDQPVWVPARGTDDWRLRLRRALPKGRYTLITRAITRNGAAEGAFTFKDRNKIRFRIG